MRIPDHPQAREHLLAREDVLERAKTGTSMAGVVLLELDLMAELAGMTLAERWGGWRREPFTAASDSHVSVWHSPG